MAEDTLKRRSGRRSLLALALLTQAAQQRIALLPVALGAPPTALWRRLRPTLLAAVLGQQRLQGHFFLDNGRLNWGRAVRRWGWL